jgi:hypothetical protein
MVCTISEELEMGISCFDEVIVICGRVLILSAMAVAVNAAKDIVANIFFLICCLL